MTERFENKPGEESPDEFITDLQPDLQPDQQTDQRFAETIRRAYVAPDPSAVFVESLKSKLSPSDRQDSDRLEVKHSTKRVAWRPISLGLVAAAAAVLMMVVWPARSAYSFDAMRERISDEAFLRVNFRGGSESFVGWVSAQGQFAAIESADSVAVAQGNSGVIYDRPTQSARTMTSGSTESKSSDARQLTILRVLDAIRSDSDSGLRLVEESWSRQNEVDGADVVLDVRFSGATPSNASFIDAQFGIRSATGLPVWISLDTDPETTSDQRLSLAYPKQGPATLSSLGITPKIAARIQRGDSLGPDLENVRSESAKIETVASVNPTKSVPAIADPEPDEKDDTIPQSSSSDVRDDSSSETPKEVAWKPTPSTRRWADPVQVDVLESPDKMAARIDQRLADVWSAAGVQPAGSADAYTLFRRMHLDLTGRIPHVAEIRQGVGDRRLPVKSLLDTMLDSPDFDSNMAAVWLRWLLPPDVELEQFGGRPALQSWLAQQFRSRTSYDQIVRQLLTAEGRVGDPGPVLFTTALEMKPDHLAKQTARTFLGTRIDCAMCHDHPYDTWTQQDFWGYAALFAQISRPRGKMNAMSSVLQVKDIDEGEVNYPDTDHNAVPRLLGAGVLESNDAAGSRRARLADWLTDPSNRQFARATVNLLWSHFFGAGLVQPNDDFGPHNPALSPELLDELAEHFIANGYDVRSVVRSIVMSETYQRSSVSVYSSSTNADQPDQNESRPLFHQMPVRWLTAEQLYDCLEVASGGISNRGSAFDPTLGIDRVSNSSRANFVQQFGGRAGSVLEYQAGIPQALALMNGSLSHLSAGEDSSRLIRGLRAPFFTDRDRIDTVFLSLVGRPPSKQEVEMVTGMIDDANSKSTDEVLSDLVWALLNGAEFATNH